MKYLLAFILAVGLVACTDGCDSTTGPDPDPPPTTTTTVEPDPVKPPRVDKRVDLYNVRGCTAFGAAALNEGELVAFISHVQARGCNILRTGSQTDGWAGHVALYLDAAAGPPVYSPAWEENLKRFLDTTARMGIAVQLIPTFTHKHQSYAQNMNIAREVVKFVKAGSEDDPSMYKHIVWEAWNEVKHPITHNTNKDFANIKKMLRFLKDETGLPVGTDYDYARGEDWIGEYPRTLRDHVDYIAFHPPRNDWRGDYCKSIRPNYWQLRKTVNRYAGKPVWIEEPMCFISDESKARYGISWHGHYALCGGKMEERRKEAIAAYMWDTENAGAVWFTHMSWGFECRYLGWLPE